MHKKRDLNPIFFCAFLCLFVANPSGCKRAETLANVQVLRISQRNEPAFVVVCRHSTMDTQSSPFTCSNCVVLFHTALPPDRKSVV